MTELENWMFLSLGTLLNIYFSPWSLPNLSEAQTFSPANANTVLNFLKSKRHILVWKALYTYVERLKMTHRFSVALSFAPKRSSDRTLFN